MMNYVIRQLEERDIASVQAVAKESWHATYDGIIPLPIQDNFLNSAYSDEMMRRRMDFSNLFVVDFDKMIVGFANFSPVFDSGKVELGAIYLLPAYQGIGLGTALLTHGIDYLRGAREIYINVEKDNDIGKRFYQSKGFEVIEEFTENFDGHELQTIRMMLKLGK